MSSWRDNGMKTHMLWHGGSSYAAPEYSDLESFDTIKEAQAEFENRIFNSSYPCCYPDTVEDGGPEAWIFFGDKPADDGDLYPDEVWNFGPHQGFRRVPA